jgi:hypothetical protein
MHGTAADYTFFDDDVLDAFLFENDELGSEASASRNDEQSKHPSETSSRQQASVNLSVGSCRFGFGHRAKETVETTCRGPHHSVASQRSEPGKQTGQTDKASSISTTHTIRLP